MPYRTTDNFISGAVLTINKITPLKQLKIQQDGLQKFAEKNLNGITDPALLADQNFIIIAANTAFTDNFRIKQKELQSNSFYKIAHEKWNNPKVDNFLKNCITTEKESFAETKVAGPNPGTLKLSACPFVNEITKEISSVLIVITM
jgi:two-component system CheB/CheR fusion protein